MAGILKNPRRESFAQGLAKGMTADAAYAAAGYIRGPNCKGNPSRMMNKPDVAARVAELLGKAADKAVITRAWVMDMLKRNVMACMDGTEDERNASAANRALELLGKEIGMFVDRRLLGVRRIDDMSEEELLEFLGGEPETTELRQASGSTPAGHA